MTEIQYGTLRETGDTLLLVRSGRMILVDAPFTLDPGLMNKTVSASGQFGIPSSAPGATKWIATRVVSHEDIAQRAFTLDQSGMGGSAEQNWLRAERELLGL